MKIRIHAESDNRISRLSLLLYFISMYTIGTISSIAMSWTPTLLILGTCAFLLLIVNNRVLVLNPVSKSWLIVVLICFLTSLISMNFRDFSFYLLTGIVIVASYSVPDRHMYKCFYIMIVGAILALAGILIQLFVPRVYDSMIYPLFRGMYRERIIRQYYAHRMYTGFNSEASICAQFMIMGMGVIYSIFPNLKQKNKKYAIVLIVVFFIGVTLTGKRSSFLFLIAALVYTSLKSATGKQKYERFLKLFLGAILVAIIAYYVLPSIVEHSSSRNALVRLLEFSGDEDVSNGRFEIWRTAIDAFKQSPIFGKGWSWYSGIYGRGVHNIYLQLLCECGIAGAIVVYVILAYLFLKSQKKLTDAVVREDSVQVALMKYCLFTQTYILLYGVTGNPLYNYSFFMWYAFSLCILTTVCKRTKPGIVSNIGNDHLS